MSFLIQEIDGVRVGLREIPGKELLIGRGTNAQLRSENPAVALEHAVIRARAGGWEIVDRGSITGTYVSGSPVESALLGAGDVIAVGDLQITVQAADAGKPLFLRLQRLETAARGARRQAKSEPAAAPEISAGAVAAKRIDYARAYGLRRALLSKTTASVAATLIALFAVGTIAARGHLGSFAPGPLATAHAAARLPDGRALFAPDSCAECHQPFAGPSDARCQECHARAFHQVSLATVGECSRCHAEHRGMESLAAVHHAQCLDCHRDLTRLGGRPAVAATITGFGVDHPQLTLAFDRGAVTERVPVEAAAARRIDSRGLRFNHECHLGGKCRARTPSAADPRRVEESLDCTSCHRIDPNEGSIIPLSYEESCARCHPLTFDNRFPPVPHGITLDAVAGVIANAYAGNRELLSKTPEEVARIFSQSSRRELDIGSATVRNAQRVLRVRCEQCHVVTGTAVEPVSVSRRWFTGAKVFDHTTHLGKGLETKCETCHAAAEKSRGAEDVLMPGIAECRTCHGDAGSARTAALGGCVTCHYYHMETARTGPGWTARAELASTRIDRAAAAPLTNSNEGGAPATERGVLPIMIGSLVVLLAIVAAFIVWSRIRGHADEPQSLGLAERAVAPPPPAAPAAPEPRPAPAPAPPPVAPAPDAPPPEPTVAVDLKSFAPAAGATTIVQWVGSLVGVEGPFAGRKIPIDPGGFYIGRDKEMSTVVVDDARVSRRHVWIGVKEGKVVAIEQESTNGTFLNTLGSAPITEVELKKGDVLILADNAASFRYEP